MSILAVRSTQRRRVRAANLRQSPRHGGNHGGGEDGVIAATGPMSAARPTRFLGGPAIYTAVGWAVSATAEIC